MSEGEEDAEIPQELECPICRNLLTDPIKLLCNHVACRECLYAWANVSQRKEKQPVRGLFFVDLCGTLSALTLSVVYRHRSHSTLPPLSLFAFSASALLFVLEQCNRDNAFWRP